MTDVHCHLDNQLLGNYTPESGLVSITNGTGWKSSEKAIELASKDSSVWACVGLAYEKGFKLSEAEKRLENLAMNDKVVGIGECGLNYRQDTDGETKIYQHKLFRAHLTVAQRLGLPVEVHNRNADEDILKILDEFRDVKVLMHCFTRGREFMNKCVENGFYMSFGGLVTYTNNSRMKMMVREVPSHLLLLETDSPYSVPAGIKEPHNTPTNVKIVAEVVAELKGCSVAELEATTDANARQLFFKIK